MWVIDNQVLQELMWVIDIQALQTLMWSIDNQALQATMWPNPAYDTLIFNFIAFCIPTLFTPLCVRDVILFTHGKHLYESIISIWKIWAHKTNLTVPLFIELLVPKPGKWAAMYMCVSGTKPGKWVVMYMCVSCTKPGKWAVMYMC